MGTCVFKAACNKELPIRRPESGRDLQRIANRTKVKEMRLSQLTRRAGSGIHWTETGE